MPFNGINDPKLPDKVRNASEKRRRAFVSAFNSRLSSCMGEDGSDKDECESSAFAVGYSAMDKVKSTEQKISLLQKFINLIVGDDEEDDDEIIGEEQVLDENKGNDLFVWKDNSGRYNWLATFSNNIRDDDIPREIITEGSHRNFVDKVTSGEWSYPETWHWHEPLWKWGQTTYVATDIHDDTVFTVAGGYANPEGEFIAEALSKTGSLHKLSHGMPYQYIKRDDVDKTLIVEHYTSEITTLPADKAANGFTFISIDKKETDMISDEKRQEAAGKLGVGVDKFEELEQVNATAAERAKGEGRDVKSVDKTVATPTSERDLSKEIAELYKIVNAMAESIPNALGQLSETIRVFREEVDEIKGTIHADKQAMSPAATIMSNIMGAVGDGSTRVDGRTSLAKMQPSLPENMKPKQGAGVTGVRMLDGLISGSRGGM